MKRGVRSSTEKREINQGNSPDPGQKHITISRGIKKRAVPSDKSAAYRVRNRCICRRDCKVIQLCEDKPDCTRRCSTCNRCNSICPDFVDEICQRLSFPPYVCNGCPDEHTCTLRRQYYLHREAQISYKGLLVGSRAGANIFEGELICPDGFLSPLIRKGQSIHHIFATNPDEFTCSEKTIHRYVNDCLLSARNIDMPRICRLRPRKTKPLEHKVDKKCRIDRTYADYLEHMAANPDTAVVEMDTVEGKKGGSVLLTLHFRSCSFMLAFLRNRNMSQSVIDVFRHLTCILGKGPLNGFSPSFSPITALNSLIL